MSLAIAGIIFRTLRPIMDPRPRFPWNRLTNLTVCSFHNTFSLDKEEAREARINLIPLLQAEEDRRFVVSVSSLLTHFSPHAVSSTDF